MNQPNQPPSDPASSGTTRTPRGRGPNVWLVLTLLAVAMLMLIVNSGAQRDEIRPAFFLEQVKAENVLRVAYLDEYQIEGTFKNAPEAPEELKDGKLQAPTDRQGKRLLLSREFRVRLLPSNSEQFKQELEQLYVKHRVEADFKPRSDVYGNLLLIASLVVPLLVMIILIFMLRRTRDQLMGGGFLSGFGKSGAVRYEQPDKPTTFADVAGLEGVKADLQELVEYLKSPEKFRRLGGRVPKGVLLNGPPGTGKTLLARAVAGEAGVPFYSVNGSEFIQMFVGVGASRVRDLFQTAKQHSPSIVFIDEIDAVGRQRGAGLGGGHDEREQTLNQILSEMDGFSQNDSVIVLAATNRPDVLDPALLRPGRFDRHVTVDRPTLKGRLEIFKVHVRDVPLAEDVDLRRLAAGCVGLTGADIRNLVNEAALWATRNNKDRVEMEDFEYARDKVLMGPKREEVLLGEEKEKTAYHEAGHALLAWLTPAADRVHKVTIIPRGRALGVTQIVPEEDRMNISESELRDRLAFMLGGRAAEKLVYGEFSAGAENDLERATEMARRMVTRWGMSSRLGPISYRITETDPFLGREFAHPRQFSEHTLQVIDEEVSTLLNREAQRAMETLTTHRDKLDQLTSALLEREELSEAEIEELIGPALKAPGSSKNNGEKPRITDLAAKGKDSVSHP